MKTDSKLPQEFKDKWITALRSGEFEQGIHYLCKDNKYCCLGVADVIAGYSPSEQEYITSHHDNVPEILRGENILTCELSSLNDSSRLSFNEIADYIQKNL